MMNKFIAVVAVTIFLGFVPKAEAQHNNNLIQSEGCPSSEELSEESSQILEECSTEVERAVIRGLDAVLEQSKVPSYSTLRRKRRETLSHYEKRLTGCILQCVFGKYGALDEDNLPSVKGLLKMSTEGVSNRGYLTAISKSVNKCYQHIWDFRNAHNGKQVLGGQTCDVVYEVFDCVVEDLMEYCPES